jgi:hypothetical protein
MKHLQSDDYIAAAKKAARKAPDRYAIEDGKGDHTKIFDRAEGTMVVVPKRHDLCAGTEHAIQRFFTRACIAFAILAFALGALFVRFPWLIPTK